MLFSPLRGVLPKADGSSPLETVRFNEASFNEALSPLMKRLSLDDVKFLHLYKVLCNARYSLGNSLLRAKNSFKKFNINCLVFT